MERPTGDTAHSRSDVHRRRVSASQDHSAEFPAVAGDFRWGSVHAEHRNLALRVEQDVGHRTS